MIKSTHSNTEILPEKWSFPCLGITRIISDEQFIVLFNSENEGAVINLLSNSTYMVGDIETDWDIDEFDIYKGSVELHNE